MLIYHLRNPKTGEMFSVEINNEQEEKDIRMYATVCGWEILEVEEA